MNIKAKNYAFALLELSEKNPKNIPKIARSFYLHLLKERKIKMLPFILDKLDELERERMKTKEIEVESVFPLTLGQKKKVKKIFKGWVVLKEKINPDNLGGIILKTDETVVDGSLKSNLERLKERLWQRPIK